MSKKKIEELEKKLEELEKSSKNQKKSTDNKLKGIVDFQCAVSDYIVPYQKVMGYLVSGILAFAGFVIIVMTAFKAWDNDHMKHPGYTTGGSLIAAGAFLALVVYLWTGFVVKTKTGKFVNALMFEKNLLTNNYNYGYRRYRYPYTNYKY